MLHKFLFDAINTVSDENDNDAMDIKGARNCSDCCMHNNHMHDFQ